MGSGTTKIFTDNWSPQDIHSFLWIDGKIVDFGRSVVATAINNRGQVVGFQYPRNFSSTNFSFFEATPVLYENHQWQSILPHDAIFGSATVLNSHGQFAGQLCPANVQNTSTNLLSARWVPARWDSEALHWLEVPSRYTSGTVTGINNENQVVGYLHRTTKKPASLTDYAVMWDKDAVILLGNLPGADDSEAVAINNKNCVLCMVTYGSKKLLQYYSHLMNSDQLANQASSIFDGYKFGGYIYDKGKITPMMTSGSEVIGIDRSKGILPRAFNDENIVVGRATALDGELTAFIWQNSKMINLNTLISGDIGWTLTEAKGINNRGQIVGIAKYKKKNHAFLLTDS